MKMIPNHIFDNVKSNAENKVFHLFQNIDLGPGWVTFHSLNVAEHTFKKWSEIDFVVVGPRGMMCLEVKGGGVEFKDGIWRFTNRFSQIEKKKEGPFDQVREAHYSLLKMFKNDNVFQDISTGSSEKEFSLDRKTNTGWGVIFPDITWTNYSPEMPKEIICDEKFTKDPDKFKKYITNLYDYWLNKGKKFPDLDPDSLIFKKITQYIRSDFQTSISLKNRSDKLYQTMVNHTEGQQQLIEGLDANDRIICDGGAGTGKTLIAIDTARNELNKNNKVLLVSKDNIFNAYLKMQIEPQPSLKICTSAELEKNKENFSNNKFDVLIVDEGQDLMQMEILDTFDQLIKGGLEKGRWRFFMDSNAQSGILGSFDQDAFSFLKSNTPTSFTLKNNCRNTKQIVEEAQSTTGAYIGETVIQNDGPKVVYLATNEENEAALLTKKIESLRDEGISLEDIAILSPTNFSDSSCIKLTPKWKSRIHTIDEINVTTPPASSILFSQISQFKGLERKHIMLIDTNFFTDDKLSRSLLYIAMTRANIELWVAARPEFNRMYINLQKQNMK